MAWKPEAWAVLLPDPYDPDGQWSLVSSFSSKADADSFVSEALGGEGWKIGIISHIPDEGWLVDLPNPQEPAGPWIFVESFDTKKEAIQFVRQKYGADSKGLLNVVDVMYGDEIQPVRGPRDWSPRWKKKRRGK